MLKFMRADSNSSSGVTRIWFRDEYGQPRSFEFLPRERRDNELFGAALIRNMNEFLVREQKKETQQ
jgi:hypothetical protein